MRQRYRRLTVYGIFTPKGTSYSLILISGFSLPINRFIGIYKGEEKQMLVHGSFEKEIDELKEQLLLLTTAMLTPVKILGIPITLTEENARTTDIYGVLSSGLCLSC